MDEQHSENISNFLLSKNPGKIIKQLDPQQIDRLFEKLRQHNEHLTQLSRQDALTKLPNRLYFELSANRLFAQANRHKNKVAVLTVDLDGFKAVNDRYGHAVGDALLKQVAACLHEHTREEDLVARVGGDEFIIILPCISDYTDAGTVAAKIIEAVSKIEIDGYPDMVIACCIGIAGYPLAAESIDELLVCSDKALYNAKNNGAGSFEYFTKKIKQEYRYAQKLIKSLCKKLENKSVALSYLPVYTNSNLDVSGVQVKLPGLQAITSHLEGNHTFCDKLSVAYLEKVHENFTQWRAQDIDVKRLQVFIEVNAYLLATETFKKRLHELFSADFLFKDACILRLVGIGDALMSEALFNSYKDIAAKFCFTYSDYHHTNNIDYRNLEPHYIDISLSAVYSKIVPLNKNIKFVNALIAFSHALNANVLLSNIDYKEHKEIALSSSCENLCGSHLSVSLSHKDIVSYLFRYCCHHS